MFRLESLLCLAVLLLVGVATAENNKTITCLDYCEGDDDKTGYCENRNKKNTCEGIACRKTTWDNSDIVDRSCVIKDDPLGVYPSLCYDGDFLGNGIYSCQCDDADECNTATIINIPLSVMILALSVCFAWKL